MRVTGARRGDAGFTMIELMVTLSIFGTLAALGVMPLRNYQAAQGHVGAAREVVAALRNAQVRSVNEGTTYKVTISARRVDVLRGSAGVYALARSYPLSRDVTLSVVGSGFTPVATPSVPVPVPGQDAYFYARGTASAGALTVTRASGPKTYSISIEGLTARVSLS